MDIRAMMRQAQTMQEQVKKAQERIEKLAIEGISGGGMVTILLTGRGKVERVTINPGVLGEEVDVVEDLIGSAFNDAWEKLEAKKKEEMTGAMGGVSLPPGLL